jgi:hypothetical protein
VWRANLLGSSGKGMEHFMRHLLGAGESPPELHPNQVTCRDEAPRGKLNLLTAIDSGCQRRGRDLHGKNTRAPRRGPLPSTRRGAARTTGPLTITRSAQQLTVRGTLGELPGS